MIENELKEKSTVMYLFVTGEWSLGTTFLLEDAETLKAKYGLENFNKILQDKVAIGITMEMCRLSWGEPKSKNKTITSGNKSEQWVYADNYLYFDNGILTTIQKQ